MLGVQRYGHERRCVQLLRMASAGVGWREDIPEGAIGEAMSDTASPFYEDAKSLVDA